MRPCRYLYQTMRATYAFVLSLMLGLSGFALASAKGLSHDIGQDIVICSGVGMTTITIGPDGTPIETDEVCPDGDSVFSAPILVPEMPAPVTRVVAVVLPVTQALRLTRNELTPSARGPPLPV